MSQRHTNEKDPRRLQIVSNMKKNASKIMKPHSVPPGKPVHVKYLFANVNHSNSDAKHPDVSRYFPAQ